MMWQHNTQFSYVCHLAKACWGDSRYSWYYTTAINDEAHRMLAVCSEAAAGVVRYVRPYQGGHPRIIHNGAAQPSKFCANDAADMHVAFAVQSMLSIDIYRYLSSRMRCKAALTMLAGSLPARLGHLASAMRGHSGWRDPAWLTVVQARPASASLEPAKGALFASTHQESQLS